MYNPYYISLLCKNSFVHEKIGIKSGRFDGKQWSLHEAESGITRKGVTVHGRILLGLDDHKDLIIVDGRHLLHAFVILNKKLPFEVLSFDSGETEICFKNHYLGSVTS